MWYGCAGIQQGRGAGVLAPMLFAGAMHREGERAPDSASVCLALNPLCYVHRCAGRLPVLLGGGRQPERELLCCYLCVICIAAPSWGKEGID